MRIQDYIAAWQNTPPKLEDSEEQLWDWTWSGYLNWWNPNEYRCLQPSRWWTGASRCVNIVIWFQRREEKLCLVQGIVSTYLSIHYENIQQPFLSPGIQACCNGLNTKINNICYCFQMTYWSIRECKIFGKKAEMFVLGMKR